MKRLLPLLFAFLCCFLPVSAVAAPTEAADSDTLFRLQLRLCDLGYLTEYPSGFYDDSTMQAITKYVTDFGGEITESIFTLGAEPVPVDQQIDYVSLTGIMKQPGGRIEWTYAKDMLTIGATYVLTNCTSGAIAHVRYAGGESHAQIVPVSNWDQATISGMFSHGYYLDKEPVTLTVGSYRIAASLRGNLHRTATEDNCYCLYFWGSDSGIAFLPDIEHEQVLLFSTKTAD